MATGIVDFSAVTAAVGTSGSSTRVPPGAGKSFAAGSADTVGSVLPPGSVRSANDGSRLLAILRRKALLRNDLRDPIQATSKVNTSL